MSILPDWSSIESTSRWSDILFWAGILCLVLLAVAEIGSHIYGSRSSFLVSEAARVAGIQRSNEEEAAKKQRDEEVAQLRDKLSEAEKATADAYKKAAQVEASQAERHLTPEQKTAILSAISPYPGQTIDLVVSIGDGDAYRYAKEFEEIFKVAKWQIRSGGVAQAVFMEVVPKGIYAAISSAHGAAGTAPIGAGVLMQTLIKFGLIKEGFSATDIHGDDFYFRIGPK